MVNFESNKKFSFVALCKIYSLVKQTAKKTSYPFCFNLNELSKIRHAISIHECMNCIEPQAYRCDVFEEITGVCRENIITLMAFACSGTLT